MKKLRTFCLAVCFAFALGGCAREKTALLTAHGTGHMFERAGIVTHTDASGATVSTKEIMLPWAATIPVKSGQKISVSVKGYSALRNYSVGIAIGTDADDRENNCTKNGPGEENVSCSVTVP